MQEIKPTQQPVAIVWLRNDLRINDNPSIVAASAKAAVLPIYILDGNAEQIPRGAASKLWLHHSLIALNTALDHKINFYIGAAANIMTLLFNRFNIVGVFWGHCYEPWALQQADKVIQVCQQHSIFYQEHYANYLWPATAVMKNDGEYYKVFTAYKNKAITLSPRTPVPAINMASLKLVQDVANSTTLSDFNLTTQHSWSQRLVQYCEAGESIANKKLLLFSHNKYAYKTDRNYPNLHAVSRLSAHLHFGEISPAQIIAHLVHGPLTDIADLDMGHFVSELIWREFAHYLLHHYQLLYQDNCNHKFNYFPWSYHEDYFTAWCRGATGYPLVDAGMRELWQTGYMHNRVRMVVASFLVKNLNIHWHYGRDWFWDCLFDADLANNSAGWQWVAGSGVDAAPYFRIFNPVMQGEKFDKEGGYTTRWVPELAQLPSKYLFTPWLAPKSVLAQAGLILGVHYPEPLVDLSASRQQALDRYLLLPS